MNLPDQNALKNKSLAARERWHHNCLCSSGDNCHGLRHHRHLSTKDEHCIEACPVNCIHPTKDEAGFADLPQLYVNPADCIDCGACIPVCPTNSIFPIEELSAIRQEFIANNAAYYN